MAKITSEYKGQVSEINALINTEEVLKAREKDREIALTAITQQMERQASLGDQIRSAYDKLKDVEFEGAQMKRSPLEQQYASIAESARKAAREASLAFAQGFEGMDLSVEQATELANGLEQIAQKYGQIADAQRANLDASRTWEQGWKEAFDKYMESATNAATKAGEVFGSITNNMNSAIDNFVTTGKFKFGDFARSVIQDLIKIELKSQATSLLKSVGGGLMSLLGGFFAEGGQPPINKPSVVGENGPELFVPKTAGTVVPNNALGGGQQVVNNNYVYNVSAIDAKSVASFFAENRKTMLGTMQMAQKELPYGNR
jgi:lambda family phage tail tape measure protein